MRVDLNQQFKSKLKKAMGDSGCGSEEETLRGGTKDLRASSKKTSERGKASWRVAPSWQPCRWPTSATGRYALQATNICTSIYVARHAGVLRISVTCLFWDCMCLISFMDWMLMYWVFLHLLNILNQFNQNILFIRGPLSWKDTHLLCWLIIYFNYLCRISSCCGCFTHHCGIRKV